MFVYRNTYVASSVMRLGYFWKILATNFHAKVFQVFGNFVSFRKNISFKSKKLLWLPVGQLYKKLGFFLFQHLVTLVNTLPPPLPRQMNNFSYLIAL